MRFNFLAKPVIVEEHTDVHMGGTKTRRLWFIYPKNCASLAKRHYYVNTYLL
jgi:hypothetical protein